MAAREHGGVAPATATDAPARTRPPEYDFGAADISLYVLFAGEAPETLAERVAEETSAPADMPLGDAQPGATVLDIRRAGGAMADAAATSVGQAMEARIALPGERYWYGPDPIEYWRFQVTALISPDGTPGALGVLGTPQRPSRPLPDVPAVLDALYADALARETARRGQAPQVAYVIAHIAKLTPPTARPPKQNTPDALWPSQNPKPVLRAILDRFDPLSPGEPRGYYDHYEPQEDIPGHRGYIAVGRHAAVVADLSLKTLAALVTQMQSGTQLADGGGFTDAGLQAVLARVSQWDANEDLRESVAHITELKKSGDASTAGQIGLAYSLAVIGVVLSLLSYVPRPAALAPGLALLGLSCIPFARYAQANKLPWRRLGRGLFWAGLVVVLLGGAFGFLAPHLAPMHLAPLGL